MHRVVDNDGQVTCKACNRRHGPLYLCPLYDSFDIDEVRHQRRLYRKAYERGELGILGDVFPPAEEE